MELSDKACDKTIKKIETIMAAGAQTEKIVEERSNRSKSMYVWFGNPENRVKLKLEVLSVQTRIENAVKNLHSGVSGKPWVLPMISNGLNWLR